jgi:putative ABC transport system permease protein
MGSLIKDVRYGVRSLLKHPGFSAVVIVTLALGIGANTAIFSVVNAVLLRPLPFKDAKRLVMVWNYGVEAAGGDRTPLCVADLLDWRAQNRSFESIGAFQNAAFNYIGGEVPEQVRGVNVTANLLSTLGAGVQLGRDFQDTDQQANAPRVVLLSDHFWRTRFNTDKQVLGRIINLSGVSTTIVGVLPPNLDFPSHDVELWRAIQWDQPTRRGPYFLKGVARLRPGISIEQARADTSTMGFGGNRRHCRANCFASADWSDEQTVVRREGYRPGNFRRNSNGPNDHGLGVRLVTRAPRDNGRSAGGATIRIAAPIRSD